MIVSENGKDTTIHKQTWKYISNCIDAVYIFFAATKSFKIFNNFCSTSPDKKTITMTSSSSSNGHATDNLEGEDIWSSPRNTDTKENDSTGTSPSTMMTTEDDAIEVGARHMSNAELRHRIELLDSDIRVMKSDLQFISHESSVQQAKIKDNEAKIRLNTQLPLLVSNVVEILGPMEQDGAWCLPLSPY